MKHYLARLMDQANEGDGGTAEPKTSTTDPKLEEKGIVTDDLGYEITQQEPTPKTEQKHTETDIKKETAANEQSFDKPVPKDSTTGYGDVDETKVQDPVVEKKEEPPPKKDDQGLKLDVKTLDESSAKQIKDFAEKHKLSQEQAQALVDSKVSEIIQITKQNEDHKAQIQKQIEQQKATWVKELKEDAQFGGTNFNKNINMVDKVLGDFMPNTKKMLTERKSMLPPYVMRDLATIAKELFKTPKLVRGEQPVEEAEDVVEVDSKDKKINDFYS